MAEVMWGDGGVGPGGWGASPSKGLEAFLQRDWQNVQEAVKASFFFMAAVLQEQNREISVLKQQLLDRPTQQQVEAILSRYQTRDKADDQLLSIKTALAEKADRAEAVTRCVRRGDDFDDVERSLHTLKMAVEELQTKSRDTAVTIEQVKAEGKRKAAVMEDMEKNVARKADVLSRAEGQELRARLMAKVDKEYVEGQLARRPAWSEIEGVLRDKADMATVERLNLHKASATDVDRLEDCLVEKVDKAELQVLVMAELQPLINTLEALPQRLARGALPLSTGMGQQTLTETTMETLLESLRGSQGAVAAPPVPPPRAADVEASLAAARSQIQADMEVYKDSMSKNMETECIRMRTELLGEVHAEVSALQAEVTGQISLLSSNVEKIRTTNEKAHLELVQVLNRKAYKADVAKSLQGKADREELEAKADKAEVNEALHGKADARETREGMERLMQQVSGALREVADAKVDMRRDVDRVLDKLQSKVDLDELQAVKVSAVSSNDWRMALGEVSLNLRRELADKAGREEMLAALNRELARLEEEMAQCKTGMDTKATTAALRQVESAMAGLGRRVTSELTGGRWLWRSGTAGRGGWVPWEVEVVNAAPDCLLWKKNSVGITAKVPGLYRLAIAFFLAQVSVVQVCVNGEAIFTLEPSDAHGCELKDQRRGRYEDEDRYIVRRSRHSAGQVTSIALDEYVALPPRAVLSVRIESPDKAQGFMSLHKL